jgi:hypothetical protein
MVRDGEIAQSREDLINQLRTQLGLLRKSASEYDAGDATEAIRIATPIRTLVHNSRHSTSLLKQLGVQHQMRFLDTLSPVRPAYRNTYSRRFDPGLGVIRLGSDGVGFHPYLDETPGDITGWTTFRSWWRRTVLEDLRSHRFTRADLVLFMVNKVGGAHVDPAIEQRFVALTKFNSLGWGWSQGEEEGSYTLSVPASDDDQPLGNPIPMNVRQIAHELDKSCSEYLASLLTESE